MSATASTAATAASTTSSAATTTTTTAAAVPRHFVIPQIVDNQDGWGPSTENIPEKFKGIPYAPFSKSDKLGKAADFTGQGNFPNRNQGRNRSEFTSNVATVFNFYHVDDEDTFQTVDGRPAPRTRMGGARGRFGPSNRGRGGGGNRGMASRDQGPRARTKLGRGGGRGGGPRNSWFGRWDAKSRRESSIEVGGDWKLLEEIEFATLNKQTANPGEPDDVVSAGSLEFYDASFDAVNTKTDKVLEKIDDRFFYKISTSDDPIIQELAAAAATAAAEASAAGGDDGAAPAVSVFATDAIAAALMTCTRSVFSFDVVVRKDKGRIFLDKRDGSPLDFVSVNETASEPPPDEKDSINSMHSLNQEATILNQSFSQQVLHREGESLHFERRNPFPQSEDEPAAPVLYRYRQWTLGGVNLLVRCELDAALDDDTYITVKALNEYDSKLTGIDWRQRIDGQRGAVLATELKNNSFKLARWTAQALMAGSAAIKMGYVSRVNARDNQNHLVLSVQHYRPREFANQIGLNVGVMWGSLRYFIDLFKKLDDGKYVLMRDPNRTMLHLYAVPETANLNAASS